MNKSVFLDRDGVINEVQTDRVKFVNRPEDVHLLPGVPEAIAKLRQLGFKIFVVTNQGGVGLGYMSEEMLQQIHEKMQQDLIAQHPDAIIDDIAYCPHKPKDGCACRKPKPGMILELARRHDIDLSRSWMIGDMEADVQAGKKAGCRTALIDGEYSLLDFAKELN